MPRPAVTDEEFIRLWDKHQSPAELCKILGTNQRAIYARRRRLEHRRSVQLGSKNFNPDVIQTNYRSSIRKIKGSVVVFSDAHVWPDQIYTPAYFAMLRLIKHDLKPKLVVCNGDLFDAASISRFPSSGEAIPTMLEELEAAKKFMSGIEDAAPKGCNLVFTIGNHDQRWATKLASLPEFKGVSGLDLKDHFEAWEFCWSLVLNKGVSGGETIIKHRYHSGIHSAHNNVVKGGINIVTGHTHALKAVPYCNYSSRLWATETGMIGPMPLEAGAKFLYAEDNVSQSTQGFAILHYTDDYKLLPPELVETIGTEVYWRGKPIKFRGK